MGAINGTHTKDSISTEWRQAPPLIGWDSARPSGVCRQTESRLSKGRVHGVPPHARERSARTGGQGRTGDGSPACRDRGGARQYKKTLQRLPRMPGSEMLGVPRGRAVATAPPHAGERGYAMAAQESGAKLRQVNKKKKALRRGPSFGLWCRRRDLNPYARLS